MCKPQRWENVGNHLTTLFMLFLLFSHFKSLQYFLRYLYPYLALKVASACELVEYRFQIPCAHMYIVFESCRKIKNIKLRDRILLSNYTTLQLHLNRGFKVGIKCAQIISRCNICLVFFQFKFYPYFGCTGLAGRDAKLKFLNAN